MTNKDPKSVAAARFLDNLASFLAQDNPGREDLLNDLKASGLDPDQLSNEFRALLSEHAPTWEQKAERERKAALESLAKSSTTAPRQRDDVEQEIRGLIEAMQRLGAPVTAGAYHQKFREATDTDLESLLDDLAVQYQILKSKKANE